MSQSPAAATHLAGDRFKHAPRGRDAFHNGSAVFLRPPGVFACQPPSGASDTRQTARGAARPGRLGREAA